MTTKAVHISKKLEEAAAKREACYRMWQFLRDLPLAAHGRQAIGEWEEPTEEQLRVIFHSTPAPTPTPSSTPPALTPTLTPMITEEPEDEEEELKMALELSRQHLQEEADEDAQRLRNRRSAGEQWEETPADEAGCSNSKRRKFH